MDDFADLFYPFDDEEAALQQQMAQAQALRNQQAAKRSTGAGAFFSGLAGIANKLQANAAMGDIQAQQSELMRRKAAVAQNDPRIQLPLAMKRLELQRSQRESDDANAPASPVYVEMARKFGYKLPAGMTNAQAREALGLAERAYSAEQRAIETRLNREAMAGAKQQAAEEKATARATKEDQDLAEDLVKAGVPTFFQNYNDAKAIMDANPKDLPGYGHGGGLLPDALTSGQGKDLRQAVGQMLSEYRKGQTGSGMSDAERTEYGQITGLLKSGDEEAVRKGVDRLMRAVSARTQTRAAGTPEAARRLSGRVPALKQAMEANTETPKPTGAAPAPDMVRIRDPKTGRTGWARPDKVPAGVEIVR